MERHQPLEIGGAGPDIVRTGAVGDDVGPGIRPVKEEAVVDEPELGEDLFRRRKALCRCERRREGECQEVGPIHVIDGRRR
jgi:hypothetical protein